MLKERRLHSSGCEFSTWIVEHVVSRIYIRNLGPPKSTKSSVNMRNLWMRPKEHHVIPPIPRHKKKEGSKCLKQRKQHSKRNLIGMMTSNLVAMEAKVRRSEAKDVRWPLPRSSERSPRPVVIDASISLGRPFHLRVLGRPQIAGSEPQRGRGASSWEQ